jgi:pSer/pThr/pTyr-binding forkhead associated (FHA) protein
MAGVESTRAGLLAGHRPATTMAQPCAAEDRGECTPGTVRLGRIGVIEALNGDTAVVPREDDPQSDRVEFLPGRLEVVCGPEPGLEFRFIRSVGAGVHEVTIGREPGPPGRHVRLAAATVSRSHARMRFENQQWLIENLSTTNPVQVNDREVRVGEGPRVLVDGDLIRLGEVVLRYRWTSP